MVFTRHFIQDLMSEYVVTGAWVTVLPNSQIGKGKVVFVFNCAALYEDVCLTAGSAPSSFIFGTRWW